MTREEKVSREYVPIFPEVNIAISSGGIALSTSLRKEHDGVQYLQDFFKSMETHDRDQQIRLIGTFYKEVYLAIVIGKVDTNTTDSSGEPLFHVDEDPRSEEHRIMSLLKP